MTKILVYESDYICFGGYCHLMGSLKNEKWIVSTIKRIMIFLILIKRNAVIDKFKEYFEAFMILMLSSKDIWLSKRLRGYLTEYYDGGLCFDNVVKKDTSSIYMSINYNCESDRCFKRIHKKWIWKYVNRKEEDHYVLKTLPFNYVVFKTKELYLKIVHFWVDIFIKLVLSCGVMLYGSLIANSDLPGKRWVVIFLLMYGMVMTLYPIHRATIALNKDLNDLRLSILNRQNSYLDEIKREFALKPMVMDSWEKRKLIRMVTKLKINTPKKSL